MSVHKPTGNVITASRFANSDTYGYFSARRCNNNIIIDINFHRTLLKLDKANPSFTNCRIDLPEHSEEIGIMIPLWRKKLKIKTAASSFVLHVSAIRLFSRIRGYQPSLETAVCIILTTAISVLLKVKICCIWQCVYEMFENLSSLQLACSTECFQGDIRAVVRG